MTALSEFNDVKKAILKVIPYNKRNIVQILLLGSLATGKARPNSDADIMICYKRNRVPSDDSIYTIIDSLEKAICREVDFIVMEYRNKYINHEEHDIDFFDNVRTDGIPLIDSSNVGKELVDFSQKIGLYKFR